MRLLIGTGITFAVTWIFRWLTVDFANDHFVHLSRARQILLGEVPVRDFFDPGLLLHYYASAVALDLSGHNLLGEAILTITAIAAGAALTFYLAARGSRSLIVGSAAAAIAVAIYPRLYNYPKLLLYPLALLCVSYYARRRSTGALAMLAVVTVVAFLFRHDHGLYIGIVTLVTVLLAHRDQLRVVPSVLVRLAITVGILLVPFFVFVQRSTGVAHYLHGVRTQSSSAATPRILRLPFAMDAREQWFTIDPPQRPRVFIRWQSGIDNTVRTERERLYGLTDRRADDSYVLTDVTTANIRTLVADPLVEDTHNIDREQSRVIVRDTWLQRARNATPLLRLRVGSNLTTPANALALLYYVITLLPFVGLIAMVWAWRRGALSGAAVTTMGAAVAMCLVINQGLIRESPDSRLPDVISPAVILAASIAGTLCMQHAGSARGWRACSGVAMCTLWLIVLWSAAIFGDLGERIDRMGVLAGPRATLDRWTEATRMLQLRPIDWYAPDNSTGVQALTRYVNRCTRPSDRLLVAWFEPQIFFYAERPFAGGQTYLDAGWHSSADDQQLTISRLQQQRVPIVLTNAAMEPRFHSAFAAVHQFVVSNYVEAARSGFGTPGEYAVFVKRGTIPKRMYGTLNLPCFR